jgi:hypothetical protein
MALLVPPHAIAQAPGLVRIAGPAQLDAKAPSAVADDRIGGRVSREYSPPLDHAGRRRRYLLLGRRRRIRITAGTRTTGERTRWERKVFVQGHILALNGNRRPSHAGWSAAGRCRRGRD